MFSHDIQCLIPDGRPTLHRSKPISLRPTPIAITTEGNEEITEVADDVIYTPPNLDFLQPIPAVVALQLFAYYCTIERGCDIDQPRNLAKSVTVE